MPAADPVDSFDMCELSLFAAHARASERATRFQLPAYVKQYSLKVRIAHPMRPAEHFFPEELEAIIDTGAMFSIMPLRVAEWFNKTKVPDHPEPLTEVTRTKMSAINGQPLQPFPQRAYWVDLHLHASKLFYNNSVARSARTTTAYCNAERDFSSAFPPLVMAAVSTHHSEVTLGMNVLSRWKLLLEGSADASKCTASIRIPGLRGV